MSYDTFIDNRTPFDVQPHVQLNADGQEVLVVMLSASFTAEADGTVRPADEPLKVAYADVPMGDPALSSNRYEADIAPFKPMPEVLVTGSAHAPGGRPAAAVMVGLQIGAVRKLLQVTGDRLRHLGAYSQPHPFQTMPLIWERTYGGTTGAGSVEQRNPVGIGHEGAHSADPSVLSEVANITRPDQVVNAADARPEPVGFGPLGRGWRPRLALAGTYDQAWLDQQWPLPPQDLDPRYHLCAPLDQQSPSIGPGVTATLINMTPEGRWEFRLPRLTAPVRLFRGDAMEETEFRPDTVLIEPDLRRVTLKARLSFVIRRNSPRLREIMIGHVSPILLGARRRGKQYLNPTGSDGTHTEVPLWLP